MSSLLHTASFGHLYYSRLLPRYQSQVYENLDLIWLSTYFSGILSSVFQFNVSVTRSTYVSVFYHRYIQKVLLFRNSFLFYIFIFDNVSSVRQCNEGIFFLTRTAFICPRVWPRFTCEVLNYRSTKSLCYRSLSFFFVNNMDLKVFRSAKKASVINLNP